MFLKNQNGCNYFHVSPKDRPKFLGNNLKYLINADLSFSAISSLVNKTRVKICYHIGFTWQGLGRGGTAGLAPVRRH